MTRADTYRVASMVQVHWPHSAMDDAAPEAWHKYLAEFDVADVEAAVEELIASGREHAPGVGQILQTVTERLSDIPEWDEAWDEICRLIARRGTRYPVTAEHFSHPLIANFAMPVWTELCQGPAPGTSAYSSHYAQQREAYKAMATRAHRNMGLAAIGSPRRRNAPRSLSEAMADLAPATEQPLKLIEGGRR